MRVLFSAVVLLGFSTLSFAEPLTGEMTVTALRAMVESSGTISNPAQLSKALGNPAAGALFPTVSKLFASSKGKSLAGLDWDALAAQAKTLSPQAASARIENVLKSNQTINQQTMMLAFSAPAARSATKVSIDTAAGAAAYNSIVCSTGAVLCSKAVSAIEAARRGESQEMSVSEANQRAGLLGGIFTLIDQNKANCGGDAECVQNLKEGFAGVVNAYGSSVNRDFAQIVIESGKTEKSDFTPFRGQNGQIAKGVRNAGQLGKNMGSALEECFLATGA